QRLSGRVRPATAAPNKADFERRLLAGGIEAVLGQRKRGQADGSSGGRAEKGTAGGLRRHSLSHFMDPMAKSQTSGNKTQTLPSSSDAAACPARAPSPPLGARGSPCRLRSCHG